MPIGVQCGNCGQQYQATDSIAGKRVRCRQCGVAIDVPGPVYSPAPQLPTTAPMTPPPPLTPPAPPMVGAPYQAPMSTMQWGGMAGYGARKSGGGVGGMLVLSGIIALGWAGFTGYLAVEDIDKLTTILDSVRGGVSLTIVLLLLLRIGQLFAALGVLVGMGGMLARQSWGAVTGIISAAIYFGSSWVWMPIVHPQTALAVGLMQNEVLRTSQMILRFGLHTLMHLIVPAVALLVFANWDPRTSRRRDWPTLRLLVASGALGWSLFAIMTSWNVVDGLLTVLDMADRFNTSARISWQFWTVLLLRVGCLLAAIALGAACVGLLLRQEWALPTGMSAGGAYVALAMVILILALTNRGGLMDLASQSRAVGLLIHLCKEMLVPGAALGYCLWAQNADDW